MHEEKPQMGKRSLVARQAGVMSLMHCPLCIGLALLSVVRAASHLLLVGLCLVPRAAISGSAQFF